MKTLIIGDIHGNLTSLKEVLRLAKYNNTTDRLICIGDYIDGWDQVTELIDYLIELQESSPQEHIYILGNHDEWLLNILKYDFDNFRNENYVARKFGVWIKQGGQKTYEAYLKLSDDEILRHLNLFYDQLKLYHEENNKLYVHAGFIPSLGFKKTLQYEKENLTWTRSLFETALTLSKESSTNSHDNKVFDGYEAIYIGHTPTIKYGFSSPKKICNVINVDQGCKLTGALTAWVDDEDVFFQSSPHKDYFPHQSTIRSK